MGYGPYIGPPFLDYEPFPGPDLLWNMFPFIFREIRKSTLSLSALYHIIINT